MVPWGGGEVREVILISRQNQNCPFLKTDSLADTFFWTKNFKKIQNVMWKKFWKCFWHSKNCFFRTLFFKKNSKKILKNFSPLKKFPNVFWIFFKKFQKYFQNFSSEHFTFFWKFLATKKVSAKLSVPPVPTNSLHIYGV